MRGVFAVVSLLAVAVVVSAAAGCWSGPARDTGTWTRGIRVADWHRSTRARHVTEAYGVPTVYAGPVSAGGPQAGTRPAQPRGTCTRVTIRLPGIILYEGNLGSLIATVEETTLTAGDYTMSYAAGSEVASITPWENEELVLRVTLHGWDWAGIVFESYLASMKEPVPLRVIDARLAAGAAAGTECHACMGLAHLAADDGQDLVEALGQSLPLRERGDWSRWAADLSAQVAWAAGQTSLHEQVQGLLATGGSRSLPRWQSARAAVVAPARRQAWQALAAWEKTLWRAYLAQYGESMQVTEPAQRDLHFTDRVRFSMALRMSPPYMAPGAREAAEELFNNPMFIGSTVAGISAYLLLLVAPEPILTKASAVLTTIALISLAGFTASELVTLAHAWMRLRDESERARSLGDLERAAAHFGQSIGGSAVRILAVLATVTVGKALPSPPPSGSAPAPVTVRIPSRAGGTMALAVADVVEIGWAVHVLKSGAVILMATSAAGGGGQGPGPGGGGGSAAAPARGHAIDPAPARGAGEGQALPGVHVQEPPGEPHPPHRRRARGQAGASCVAAEVC